MATNYLARRLMLVAGAIVVVVVAGIWISYVVARGSQPLMVTLTIVAAITYFGILALPGDRKIETTFETTFTEARIRLALASTFVMVYLVYLSIAIWWTVPKDAPQTEAPALVATLTDLLKIVLPFYFGVSGAVEIAKSRSTKGVASVGVQVPEGSDRQS